MSVLGTLAPTGALTIDGILDLTPGNRANTVLHVTGPREGSELTFESDEPAEKT